MTFECPGPSLRIGCISTSPAGLLISCLFYYHLRATSSFSSFVIPALFESLTLRLLLIMFGLINFVTLFFCCKMLWSMFLTIVDGSIVILNEFLLSSLQSKASLYVSSGELSSSWLCRSIRFFYECSIFLFNSLVISELSIKILIYLRSFIILTMSRWWSILSDDFSYSSVSLLRLFQHLKGKRHPSIFEKYKQILS